MNSVVSTPNPKPLTVSVVPADVPYGGVMLTNPDSTVIVLGGLPAGYPSGITISRDPILDFIFVIMIYASVEVTEMVS